MVFAGYLAINELNTFRGPSSSLRPIGGSRRDGTEDTVPPQHG
jgi:hypothetical protein